MRGMKMAPLETAGSTLQSGRMVARFPLALIVLATTLAWISPVGAQTCTGDCDASGTVTVDEVVTGVSIALGSRNIEECLAFDSSGDNRVTVDEILQASTFALDGCLPVATRTPTAPSSPTPTASRSPSPTQPVEPGPFINYFGIAGASNRVLTPTGTDGQNRPIYEPTCRNGFFIVVEGRPNPGTGTFGPEVGRRTFNSDPANASVRPDLQLLANRDLGNGSTLICDHRSGLGSQPPFGGIPGFAPIDFNPSSQRVADALNDIGCRFSSRTTQDPCTVSQFGNPRFVDTTSTIQFCNELTIDAFWALPLGDTVFAVQLRDINGLIGQRKEIVVRPANDCP